MTLTAERLKEMAMMIEHYGADSGCASDQELIEACELALLALAATNKTTGEQ